MLLEHTFRTSPGTLWIGGRAPVANTTGGPSIVRGAAVLWLDAASDEILAARVVHPFEADDVFADLLGRAIWNRGGVTPERVRVASESHAVQVRARLPGAVIVVGETPEIPRVACRLTEDADPPDEIEPGYLQGGAFPAEAMARFFELMAALYRTAPSRFFSDRHVLELEVREMDVWGACVSVMGAPGRFGGVGVFESIEDFETLQASLGPPTPWPRAGTGVVRVASLGLLYRRAAELPEEMRLEAGAHGWVVADADAYPMLVSIGSDGHRRPATERDLQLGCALAAALAELVREHEEVLRSGSGDEFSVITQLEGPDPVEARLWFPHPDSQAEAPGRYHRPGPGAERAHWQADQMLAEFRDSACVLHHGYAWRANAVFILSMFHGFRLDRVDARLVGMRASHLAEFLLDHVPREVLANEEVVRHTPEVFDAYLGWLARSRFEPRSRMKRMRALVRCLRDEFTRRALDPSSFSPGKTFLVSAEAAGLDLDDFEAVGEYCKRYERESDRALEAGELPRQYAGANMPPKA
jgi:hypothetical protein